MCVHYAVYIHECACVCVCTRMRACYTVCVCMHGCVMNVCHAILLLDTHSTTPSVFHQRHTSVITCHLGNVPVPSCRVKLQRLCSSVYSRMVILRE